MSSECERFNEAQRHHKTHLHRHHLLGIVSESDISFGALFFILWLPVWFQVSFR